MSHTTSSARRAAAQRLLLETTLFQEETSLPRLQALLTTLEDQPPPAFSAEASWRQLQATHPDCFPLRRARAWRRWALAGSAAALAALVLAYVTLYKTRFGLRLCACGEHPQAADSVGINVYRMRYAGVLISGVLGGLGGIVYIIAGVSEWKFENGVAGFGFLALAVMIFGQWKPTRIALAALLFGFFRALGNVYSGFDLLSNLNLPSSVYNMLPYVISLVVLAFTSQKSRAPKAEGIPYDKGQR